MYLIRRINFCDTEKVLGDATDTHATNLRLTWPVRGCLTWRRESRLRLDGIGAFSGSRILHGQVSF